MTPLMENFHAPFGAKMVTKVVTTPVTEPKRGGAKICGVLCKKYGKYRGLEKMVEPLGSRWSMKAN